MWKFDFFFDNSPYIDLLLHLNLEPAWNPDHLSDTHIGNRTQWDVVAATRVNSPAQASPTGQPQQQQLRHQTVQPQTIQWLELVSLIIVNIIIRVMYIIIKIITIVILQIVLGSLLNGIEVFPFLSRFLEELCSSLFSLGDYCTGFKTTNVLHDPVV